MLASVSSCLLSWLLLAALSPQLWRVTLGTPLKIETKSDASECVTSFRALLNEVSRALDRDDLFGGFNCTEESMEVSTTLLACEPSALQNGGCASTQNIRFNKVECLGNIKADLEYHREKLHAYRRKELDSTVLTAIRGLLEKCDFPSGSHGSSVTTTPSSVYIYDLTTRRRLCRELKGFHARTITTNRIMGYVAAL